MFSRLRKHIKDRSKRIMQKTVCVEYKGENFYFHVPNYICGYRAETFASKEPETLAWIDSFDKGAVFWDIGANVGLYSIYAAATRSTRTFAFEPSIFNLEILGRNIFLNKLYQNVCIVPVALNNKAGANQFRLPVTDWGGALSSFDHPIDQFGKPINSGFEFRTVGITMDAICDCFDIPMPDYLKIDVDGIEHLLLEKADAVLDNCLSLLIEYSGLWQEQASQIENILHKHGFSKTFIQNFDPNTNPSGSMNTIWTKQ